MSLPLEKCGKNPLQRFCRASRRNQECLDAINIADEIGIGRPTPNNPQGILVQGLGRGLPYSPDVERARPANSPEAVSAKANAAAF